MYDIVLKIRYKLYRISLLIFLLCVIFYFKIIIFSFCSGFVSLVYLILSGRIILVVISLIFIVLVNDGEFVLVFDFSGLFVFIDDFLNR